MTSNLCVGIVALIAFSLCASSATAADLAAPGRVSDRIVSDLVATNGVPGMGAAVWIDGRVVWTGSAGLRDIERGLPVDGNTIFRLASVSKVVAATAAARLVQEGKLDPDVPVISMMPLLRSDWSKITTRHLAAHISGLPHYQDADDDRGRVHYATVDDAVRIFAKRDLLFAPGLNTATRRGVTRCSARSSNAGQASRSWTM